MVSTIDKGREAEETVVRYLSGKGWTIIERNYIAPGGEIDIIASTGKQIVFVEVKSSRSAAVDVTEMLTGLKLQRIKKSALRWLQDHGRIESDWRIDFVGLQLQKKRIERLHHLENVAQ